MALSSRRLGDLIVDALVHAGLVKRDDVERASEIAEEEIDARKAVRDYCECQQKLRSHRAKIIWKGRAPATPHYYHPARFNEKPPPWPDDTWTLSCDFDVPPAEQGSVGTAKVQFVAPGAPDERLTPGTKLWLFEGPSLVATVEILD